MSQRHIAAAVMWSLVSGLVMASEPSESKARATLLLVRGADGTEEFGKMFDEWQAEWEAAADEGDVALRVIGADPAAQPREELRQSITDQADGSDRPLWIVLIGHGTWDGRSAKFNLVGPDVSAAEIADWLQSVRRPLAIINCASSSAPFIDRLSSPDRVVITATNSGHEVNFARFGSYFSSAIHGLSADLDKDEQVSLLEAFLTASRRTNAYYEGVQQLATEHALLDDNGDRRGTAEGFFEGLTPSSPAEEGASLDGRRAHLWHLVPSDEERRFPDDFRRQRDELELAIAQLRDTKPELDESDYYDELEKLLVELAELYEQADQTDTARDDSKTAVPDQQEATPPKVGDRK